MLGLVAFYKENAAILRRTFEEMGFEVYGGENAPYVWVGFPGGWLGGWVGGWVGGWMGGWAGGCWCEGWVSQPVGCNR
jgi:hypothetical protein